MLLSKMCEQLTELSESTDKSQLHSTTMERNVTCGKGQVRTQDSGYQVERIDHCDIRPVESTDTYILFLIDG